jgi:hypothetical protein
MRVGSKSKGQAAWLQLGVFVFVGFAIVWFNYLAQSNIQRNFEAKWGEVEYQVWSARYLFITIYCQLGKMFSHS